MAALAVAGVCALGATLPAGALAQEDPTLEPAFAYGGSDCVEPSVTVAVPVDRARAAVPEPYVPRSLSGDAASADVLLAVARCERLNVDGQTVSGRVVVDAGVVIETPDGTSGAHVYQLWQLSDSREVSAAMASVGVRGGQVAGLGVDDASTALADGARATVPWTDSPYDLAVDGAVGDATSASSTTWWHRGPRGIVRLGYSFPRAASRFGAGKVSAREGSPLAQLLGGTSASGNGFVGRLDFAGRVRAERPAASAPPSSGAPGPGGSAPSSPAPSPSSPPAARGRAALRLAVTPRRVAAGRRVRLTVRATAGGRPVRGALVRVAGRRARTDARGRARVTVRLRRGRHGVSATTRTGRRARTVVVAR
jgi:hypothetical protein